MTSKIKIFFVFLAALAVVSVLSFFDIFGHIKLGVLSSQIAPLAVVPTDTDHDGLSDKDESYWGTDFQNPDTDGDGFLDGEEVASNHDPNKPGPDDILINSNLTQRVADLAAAGLVEGSLKPGSANYDSSLEDLTLSVIDDSMTSLNSTLDLSRLKVVDPSNENQELYINESQDLLKIFVQTMINQANELQSNSENLFPVSNPNADPDNAFLEFYSEFKSLYDKAVLIPVPRGWEKDDTTFLTTLNQLVEIDKAMAYRARDPIKAMAALKLLISTYNNLDNLISSYADQLRTGSPTNN